MPRPSGRALAATYLCGFFSLSLLQMASLATPLLGGALGISAATFGIMAGARSLLPLAYSIHIGALMDVVGVRRVMLIFSGLCAVLPPLYPLTSSVPMLVALQFLLGLASAIVWMAAQTAIARVGSGDRRYAARFSFITVAGTVLAPLLLGFAWQAGGIWGGYGLIGLWGLMLTGSALLYVPRSAAAGRGLGLRDAIPRPAAYRRGWTLLLEPVAAFVMACTFLRLAAFGIVESFYPVLLQQDGHSPVMIGALVALANLASSPASLAAGWWVRVCRSETNALLASLAILIASVTVVPLLSPVWLLGLSMICFGFALGVSLPLLLTMLSRSISPDEQGIAAGLRGTVNRLAAFVLPVAMGMVAHLTGVGGAFWVTGSVLMALLVLVAAFAAQSLKS